MKMPCIPQVSSFQAWRGDKGLDAIMIMEGVTSGGARTIRVLFFMTHFLQREFRA
jgi:hypothetical protein